MSPVTVIFKWFIYEFYDCTHKQLHMYMCGIYIYILNCNQNTEYERVLHSSLTKDKSGYSIILKQQLKEIQYHSS